MKVKAMEGHEAGPLGSVLSHGVGGLSWGVRTKEENDSTCIWKIALAITGGEVRRTAQCLGERPGWPGPAGGRRGGEQ